MGERQDRFSGTMPVREALAFDPAPLEAYMHKHVEGFTPPISMEQFKGGQSNPTYRLIDGAGKKYVLRRKPPGKLLKSAHAVDREYRVMTALGQTDVPVPKTYALCEDESVVGTPFFIMDCVEGRIFWEATLPNAKREDRPALYDAMNDAMAKLHNVNYAAIGLGDYGKPGSYFARQIKRWSSQYLADEEAGRFDAMDRLIEWLPENIPDDGDETAIAHGDFRIDNMIMHPTENRVIAILDWELSTLGHPLSDFAYNCLPYRLPAGMAFGIGGLDLEELNIPSEEDYIAAYCKRTGRNGIPDMDYYQAFNMFRLAGILHGILGRVKRGSAASKHAAVQGQLCEPLANLAWEQAEKVIRKAGKS